MVQVVQMVRAAAQIAQGGHLQQGHFGLLQTMEAQIVQVVLHLGEHFGHPQIMEMLAVIVQIHHLGI